MPDTNPLPASEFRKLAHDVCFWRRQGGNDPNYNPGAAISLGAAIHALDAALEASPVTLEEHLLAEERRTEIESIKACDVDDNPDLVAIVTAADDARNARKQHARRLAGEGGGKC